MWWSSNTLISRFVQTLSTIIFGICVYSYVNKHEPTWVENIGDNIQIGVTLDDCGNFTRDFMRYRR